MAKTPADSGADTPAKTKQPVAPVAEPSETELAAADVRDKARKAPVRLLGAIRVLDLGSETKGKRNVIDETRFLALESNPSEVDRWSAADANMREADENLLADLPKTA